MEAIETRVSELERWRDGNGKEGAAAHIADLRRCRDAHDKKFEDLDKWMKEDFIPFMTSTKRLNKAIIWIGSLIFVSILALLWAILTHDVSIVR